MFATAPTISGAILTASPALTTPSFDVAGTDATGDIYYNGGSGVFTRLAAGSSNEFLRITGGLPDWDNTALLTNPQTASSTFTATTSLNGSSLTNNALIINGLTYQFPSTAGKRGQVLGDSTGTGVLTWGGSPRYTLSSETTATISGVAYSTSSPITIPAGTLAASSTISIEAQGACATTASGGNNSCYVHLRNSSGQTLISTSVGGVTSQTFTFSTQITLLNNGSVSSQNYIGSTDAVYGTTPTKSNINGTTAINFASEQTFYIVSQSEGNISNYDLNAFYVVVNP